MKYFFLTITLLGFLFTNAQNGLITLTHELKQEFVKAHNKWRADVNVPDLVWSTQMENLAKDWAKKQGKKGCKMKHRPNNEFGENLYWSMGLPFSPTAAIDDWGSEIKYFKPKKTFSNAQMKAGHYTQMVWRNTSEVGCAAYRCGKEILVVCNYNPAGNWLGEYPYKK